jgi:hypothetical protein
LRTHPAAVIGAAIVLGRPTSEIWSRISELHLERDEPGAYVVLRRGIKASDAEVDIHDAAGFGSAP